MKYLEHLNLSYIGKTIHLYVCQLLSLERINAWQPSYINIACSLENNSIIAKYFLCFEDKCNPLFNIL